MVGGKLLSRFAPDVVISSGYACKAVAAAGMALVFTPTVSPWLLTLPLLVWGIGGGLAGAPVMAVAMNVTDKAHAGMVAGTITSLASIGAGIGTAALGVVYEARIDAVGAATPEAVAAGASAVLAGSAILAVATIVAVLVLIGPRRTVRGNRVHLES